MFFKKTADSRIAFLIFLVYNSIIKIIETRTTMKKAINILTSRRFLLILTAIGITFYVYKYATGIISAISIAKRILTEGETAVKDYFTFLSSGGCQDPVSILKKAGVDLTTKAPFEAAMQEFEETLNEFKSLL